MEKEQVEPDGDGEAVAVREKSQKEISKGEHDDGDIPAMKWTIIDLISIIVVMVVLLGLILGTFHCIGWIVCHLIESVISWF